MRISADVIDEDQCNACESQGGTNRTGTKVRVVLRDPPKQDDTTKVTLEDVLKEFQNLSICVRNSNSVDGHSTNSEKPEFLMEGASGGSTSQPSVGDKECHDSEERSKVPFWYNKMKAELKKEVVDEVLMSFSQKFLPEKSEVIKHSGNVDTSDDGKDVVHTGVFCDNCDELIRGIRYKCGNCEDFDLCEKCESEDLSSKHDMSHIFLKIRIPSCFFTLQEGTRKKIFQVPLKSIDNSDSLVLNKAVVGAPSTEREKAKNSMKAKFICDETIPDGTSVYPGMKFVKTWRVCNSGTEPWTKDTVFRLVWSYQELKPSRKEVLAPQLNSGEEGVVSVSFMAPEVFGEYESYWEFHHLERPFGDTFWCRIRVDPIQPVELLPLHMPNRSSAIKALKFQHHHQCLLKNKRKVKEEKRKKRENRKKEVKQIVDVLAAVHDDQDCNGSGISQRKQVLTSQTATPNNTPFDLTPPKSPEPQEFVDIKNEVSVSTTEAEQPLEEKLNNVSVCVLDGDDKASIATLSSSESDSEFVVIPMPKCFSLLETCPSSRPSSQVSHLQLSKSGCVQDTNKEKCLDGILVKECGSTTSISFQKQDSAENVSQEIDVPEETENVNVITTIRLQEDCDKNLIVSNVSLSCSPSSSSISIVGSESNSPTAKTLPQSIPSHPGEVCNVRSPSPPVRDVNPQSEEQHEESASASSFTFPKFPVSLEPDNAHSIQVQNTVSSTEESAPKQDGERTIQVLPEGLVTGALLAAATVYNTARAVISNFQPGRNDEEENHSRSSVSSENIVHISPLEQLLEMGFCNRELNQQLLRENSNDVARVVAELVSLNDNDWYASRHNPSLSSID